MIVEPLFVSGKSVAERLAIHALACQVFCVIYGHDLRVAKAHCRFCYRVERICLGECQHGFTIGKREALSIGFWSFLFFFFYVLSVDKRVFYGYSEANGLDLSVWSAGLRKVFSASVAR